MLEFLKSIYKFFTDFFKDYVFCAFQQAICWTTEKIYDIVTPIILSLAGMVPVGTLNGIIENGGDIYGAVNYWLPLGTFVSLFLAFHAFNAGFIVVKFILKMIPTIG